MQVAGTMAENAEHPASGTSFMTRAFQAFSLLALLSLGISLAGKMVGQSIAMAGHTEDTTLHEVVIGNNVLAIPANAIRFERARRDGVAARVDLYLHWPQMKGYSRVDRDDFNHAGGSRNIVFVSIEEQPMSRDMSGRLQPIYSSMLERPGREGPAGVTLFAFGSNTGYVNELLAVAGEHGDAPFVARCLSGDLAADSLAPCERDIHFGDGLSLAYRFPRELLGEWQRLDAAIRGTAAAMLRTGR